MNSLERVEQAFKASEEHEEDKEVDKGDFYRQVSDMFSALESMGETLNKIVDVLGERGKEPVEIKEEDTEEIKEEDTEEVEVKEED